MLLLQLVFIEYAVIQEKYLSYYSEKKNRNTKNTYKQKTPTM